MKMTIRSTGDLKAVTRQLRTQADGKELTKDLRVGLREVANPVRDEVKQSYRALPSTRGGVRRRGGSLRGALARATRTEVRTSGKLAGVRVRVDGRKMPVGQRSLPKYVEGYKRPWRHPVYGDRDTWATQTTPRGRFDVIVESHETDADEAVDQVLDGIRAKLERR